MSGPAAAIQATQVAGGSICGNVGICSSPLPAGDRVHDAPRGAHTHALSASRTAAGGTASARPGMRLPTPWPSHMLSALVDCAPIHDGFCHCKGPCWDQVSTHALALSCGFSSTCNSTSGMVKCAEIALPFHWNLTCPYPSQGWPGNLSHEEPTPRGYFPMSFMTVSIFPPASAIAPHPQIKQL